MFIIVEGPDGSGKSCLVDAILKQAEAVHPDREIVYYHMGKPEEESRLWVLNQWAASVEMVDWTDGYVVVADRWHWGEVTYAPIKRPHTCQDEYGLLGVGGWRLVELMLLSRGAVQFVLMQPPDVLARRVGARGDDFVNVDELERIHSLYMSGIEKAARVEMLTPNPDNMSAIPDLAVRVLEIAREREHAARSIAQFPMYIGSPRPRVLLVGDRRNDPNGPILPFYPAKGNSGDYLLSNLPDPFWKTVGVVNGTELCDSQLAMLWTVLGEPRVVALGRMAEKSLSGLRGIPRSYINVVPHPQYVRRFHHHDGQEYGRAVERLSNKQQEKTDRWILR